MAGYRVPTATYRLQFNRDFAFNDARALVPYLHRLGISHIYASPIFQARSGSAHGYDVTDPTRLNPELGTLPEFEALVQELQARGMGLLLDLVPNHMAASPENPWWVDLLENGPSSPYAGFFDVDWNPAAGTVRNQIVLPILGKPYHEVLESGELVLGLDRAGLNVRYFDYRLPLEVKSYGMVLSRLMDSDQSRAGSAGPHLSQLRDIIAAAEGLSPYDATRPQDLPARHRSTRRIKEKLLDRSKATPLVSRYLEQTVALFNGKQVGKPGGKPEGQPGGPASFDLLHQLLGRQPYRLLYWMTGRDRLNYRRFFDIADLSGIRVEDPRVFAATHSLALRLAREGKIDGLRLDHIDGLYDPSGYLHRLQTELAIGADGSQPDPAQNFGQSSGPSFYVVVEKILSHDESLPSDWPVAGTTGYDFLNILNGVFVDREGFATLVNGYRQITGSTESFEDVVYANKKRAINELFGPEFRNLTRSLAHLAGPDRYADDLPEGELARALIEVTACLNIYRTYHHGDAISGQEREFAGRAVAEARRRSAGLDRRALDFVQRVALGQYQEGSSPEQRSQWDRFLARWSQVAGPVMAKGLEDTSLYSYNPLVSLNEVGGTPTAERLSIGAFHQHNARQQRDWPHGLNATASHDTKRSEDVRARINVLSEIAGTWTRRLRRWISWNRASKRTVAGQSLPEVNLEVLLYQTLLGAWPLAPEQVPQFKTRLLEYLIKAARESKTHTSWIAPDPDYEAALVHFVEAILEDSENNRFLADFLKFQKRIACYGALNSLSQTLLKITSPGVPDFYQGLEMWDFSLVDPDNRRPVDFGRRTQALDRLPDGAAGEPSRVLEDLLRSWEDGRAKLYLTHRALRIRRELPELFQRGEYIPLPAPGDGICAFARRLDDAWALIAAPRFYTRLARRGRLTWDPSVWGDGTLVLPENSPRMWDNAFTGGSVRTLPATRELPLAAIFESLPIALLYRIGPSPA
jgi:(1->4)-alpha-D-glucan 1-alpha-D-glucosylmutase